MSTRVDSGSHTGSRDGRYVPAYGPVDAVLGYALFYVVVDRATPTVVDVGTTVQFEWTGDGLHNVVEDGGGYESGAPVQEAGVNFEHTYDEAGISKYYCDPHESAGMKGAVVVGDDYPAVQQGVSTPVNPEHVGVPFQAHWVGISTIVAILVSIMFTFYTLKYGESPNTKGGNN